MSLETEYREGFEAVYYAADEPDADRMIEFLQYSGIEDTFAIHNKSTGSYEVHVKSKQYNKAHDLVLTMAEEELEQEDDAAAETEDSIEDTEEEAADSILYSSTKEKYKDNLSSAYTFLVCGIIGLIVLLLHDFGIVHIFSVSGASNILLNVVTGGMFLGFIIIALLDFRYSKKLKKIVAEEAVLSEEILEYLTNTLTAEEIDSRYDGSLIAEEAKYFHRTAVIKELLEEKYTDMKADFVTHVIDQFYAKTFGTKITE